MKKTRDKGIILKPDRTKSLESFADADFAGNWYQDTAEYDASTAKSQTGFIMLYADFPVLWCSKLQTQVTLSTTEEEYVSLSHSLRAAIPLINLLNKMTDRKIITINATTTVYCKTFEDKRSRKG